MLIELRRIADPSLFPTGIETCGWFGLWRSPAIRNGLPWRFESSLKSGAIDVSELRRYPPSAGRSHSEPAGKVNDVP